MTQEINVSPGKINLLLIELKQKYGWELFVNEYGPNSKYKSVKVCWPSRQGCMVVVNIGQNTTNEYGININYRYLDDDEFTFKPEEIEIFLKILQKLKEANYGS